MYQNDEELTADVLKAAMRFIFGHIIKSSKRCSRERLELQ